MSGSPVYIDGKLLGAIGYGWGFADGRIRDGDADSGHAEIVGVCRTKKGNAGASHSGRRRAAGYAVDDFRLYTEALDYLTQKLAPYNLVPHAAGAAGSYDAAPQPLEPGSAVAVTLVTGDA